MLNLYNSQNIEKEVLGEVFELPKEEKKPLEIIQDIDNFIFNSVKNVNK